MENTYKAQDEFRLKRSTKVDIVDSVPSFWLTSSTLSVSAKDSKLQLIVS
jgi:hypothetical protein